MAGMKTPLVSWLIPTTLYRHPWRERLVEYLTEDFPAEQLECIVVGTQDENFLYEARRIGEQICESLAFIPDITERWSRVRFIEQYNSAFNIASSRNMLLDAARGDIVIYRDADTALLRPGFTDYAVRQLLRSRYGMLSFPSLLDNKHFKPKQSLITLPDPFAKDLSLACSVNGMATIALKSILDQLGGWNVGLQAWGEHTALCTKMARAGLLMGYTNSAYWLSTVTGESTMSLTNDALNPHSLAQRQRGVALLQAFYDIKPSDMFWRISQQDYGVTPLEDTAMSAQPGYSQFAVYQQLNPSLERYNFKPWECLSHPMSSDYIRSGRDISKDFFEPVLHERFTAYTRPHYISHAP
jgi:hypothetical protein